MADTFLTLSHMQKSNAMFLLPVAVYGNTAHPRHVASSTFVNISNTATESVLAFEMPEPELIPYNVCRSSGALSFWDDPSEDIYSFDDGNPV
ncbi:MAG: hypothetical protein KAJ46_00930 [Sedimentisphaerales bacterium]|nr:hypothetical protein [Sedimentisphaerales bacterium]